MGSRRARSAVGLDIGTSGVRAAEVVFGRGGPTLARLGQVALPPGAVRDGEVVDQQAVSAAVRRLWSTAKISSKDVVLGVANQSVIVRQVELPWLPAAELAASLPYQVADVIAMPIDEAVLDFVPAGEFETDDGGRIVRGLLIAASEQMIMRSIEAVTAAGLTVSSVDLTPFAVLRSLRTADPHGLHLDVEAVVDIGARITTIVVHQGGAPKFVRILRNGVHDLVDALVDHGGVAVAEAEHMLRQVGVSIRPDDESDVDLDASGVELRRASSSLERPASSLVDEIRGSLDYYTATAGADGPRAVILTGGGSCVPGLVDRLSRATRLPVVPGDAFAGLSIGKTGLSPEQLRVVMPIAVAPVGLALGVAS